MDHSPRGSSVHGILQARTQEWAAMPSSSGSSRPGDYVVSLPCLYWQVGSLPVAPPGSAFTCSVCSATQLCLSLFDPMDCSLPGSSVHGILQARTQEWVAMPSFRGSSQPGDQTCLSCIVGGFFTTEPQGKSKCPLIDEWIKTMCLYMQWNDT